MASLSKQNAQILRATVRKAERLARPASTGGSREDGGVGLGVDLIEIERMEQALKRTPRILERVFTEGERTYAWSKARPAVHYASFFAAREAVLKALGTGFANVGYADVEVVHDDNGKPEILLHNNASIIAQEQGVIEIQISLSHTHTMAVASAVALKAASRPYQRESLDPMEELAREFKQLRSLLDNLEPSGIIESTDKEGE
jgi:holo-[acyl-carrier protein] synthase